jgi:acyl carrier protein
MMDVKETKEKVRRFIAENYLMGDGRSLGDGESLLEAGVIDSTAVMELVQWLQETFAIQIADEELVPANLDSLEKIAAYVARKAE